MNMKPAGLKHTIGIKWEGLAQVALMISLALLAFAQRGPAQQAKASAPPAQAKPTSSAAPAVPKAKAEKGTAAAPIRIISDAKTQQEGGRLIVVLSTDGALEHRESELRNPPRLVIDLINAVNKVRACNLAINVGKIKQLRIRQYQDCEPKITRLAFDLEDKTGKPEIAVDSQSVRIAFAEKDVDWKPDAGTATKSGESEGSQSMLKLTGVDRPSKPAAARIPKATPGTARTSQAPATSPALTSQDKPVVRLDAPPVVAQPGAQQEPRAKVEQPQPVETQPALVQNGRFTGQPLTLDLVDIPLIDFFRLMAEEGGINIVMDPEIKGTISIKVVKVPWDQIFEAALANNGLDKQVEGNLVRIARKATLQEEARQREALKKANLLAADLETRVKRLNYAKAASFVAPLTDQKTVRGTVVVDERTNSLILNDIPSSLDKMVALIETLDTPQPQVEIEARIVSATRDFARDIGVQFGFVQGNLERTTVGGPNTFGTIGGSRPSQTPKSAYVAGNPLTGRGSAESKSSESAGTSTGTSSQNAGNWNVNLPAEKAFGGLGVSIGNIFDTFLLDAAITAGESKGLAKLISQPKTTVTNNSTGSITQGFRFPVQIVANNTVTIQFQNAALTLTVTPQITYEGNIVLDLKVENNTPDFARQVNGIPSIRTSESTTRVLVTDGGTTVIGGILIDNESNSEDRVPGLASLPIIGNVFRRTSVSHTTQEVLFFITPRIVK